MAPDSEAGSPLPRPTRVRPRIESLSDLVFGLALSLGAIALVANPPSDSGSLYSDLVTFGFSFLILIVVWLAYTRLLTALARSNHDTIRLDILLLFSVSIEPFLFNLLQRPKLSDPFFATVSQAYAVDVGVMISLLGLYAWAMGAPGTTGVSDAIRRAFRREARNRWVAAAVFFLSAAPVFVDVRVFAVPVRVLMWFVAVGLLLATPVGRVDPRAENPTAPEPAAAHP